MVAVLWSVLFGEHLFEALLRLEAFDARATFDARAEKRGHLAFHELTDVGTGRGLEQTVGPLTLEVTDAQLFGGRIDAWAQWLERWVGGGDKTAWASWRRGVRERFEVPAGFPWEHSATP